MMTSALAKHGLQVSDETMEDHGIWIEIDLPIKPKISLVVCSYDEEEYNMSIVPSQPTGRRWFKKFDISNEWEHVRSVVDAILSETPHVSEVKWSDT